MARWNPPDNIGKNERIGRRLFDEPLLSGGEEQKQYTGLDLRNFEEKRDKQTSFDRLGRTGIEKSVIRYLTPRAEVAGSNFKPPKPFNGWITLPAQRFENPPPSMKIYATPVVASPIQGEDLEDNLYHAHVVTPIGVEYYSMALHLRHLFSKYGVVEQVRGECEKPGLRVRLNKWVLLIWGRFVR